MKVALAFTLLLLAAMQAVWAASWQVAGVAPDLLRIVAISLGLNLGMAEGALAGLALGFVRGTLHGDHLGSYLLSQALAGGLAGYLRPAVSREHPLAPPLCVLGVSIVAEALFYLMSPEPFFLWLQTAVIASVYNAALAPFVHLPLSAMLRKALPATR